MTLLSASVFLFSFFFFFRDSFFLRLAVSPLPFSSVRLFLLLRFSPISRNVTVSLPCVLLRCSLYPLAPPRLIRHCVRDFVPLALHSLLFVFFSRYLLDPRLFPVDVCVAFVGTDKCPALAFISLFGRTCPPFLSCSRLIRFAAAYSHLSHCLSLVSRPLYVVILVLVPVFSGYADALSPARGRMGGYEACMHRGRAHA